MTAGSVGGGKMSQDGAERLAALRLRRLLVWSAAALLAMSAYAQFAGLTGEPLKLFVRQDRLVALATSLMLLGLAWYIGRNPGRTWSGRTFEFGYRHVVPAFIGLALLLWTGTYLLLENYAFTRDEHMAAFDAAIFAEGRLAAPVAAQWRSFVLSMEPLYTLSFPDNSAWASAYLPGNAALRAAFSLVDPALAGPVLAGIGGIVLFALGRRLFPDSGSAQAVALLIYVTSAQLAVNAMTPFAMTAHMTLNLLWLLLFLRGGLAGHAGAGMVAFVATGLHQIIFHPLFALPFLEHLRRQSRYRELAYYLVLYGLVGIFWMSYYGLFGGTVGPVHPSGEAPGLGSFIRERVVPLLANPDPAALPLMNFNLIRFVAWQNLALIPLFLCAIPAARRAEGIAQPLYLGILLTIAAMFILLPFQSIGWGYRYLHGLLGSFALLAAYGWRRIEDVKAARTLLVAGTAATLLASAPWLLWTTRQFVAPSIAADRAIERLDVDFAVIDDEDVSHVRDLVRNEPFLNNRPLRFSASHLTPADVRTLCSRGTLMLIPRQQFARFGITPDAEAEQRRFPQISAAVEGRPCLRIPNLERRPGVASAALGRNGSSRSASRS